MLPASLSKRLRDFLAWTGKPSRRTPSSLPAGTTAQGPHGLPNALGVELHATLPPPPMLDPTRPPPLSHSPSPSPPPSPQIPSPPPRPGTPYPFSYRWGEPASPPTSLSKVTLPIASPTPRRPQHFNLDEPRNEFNMRPNYEEEETKPARGLKLRIPGGRSARYKEIQRHSRIAESSKPYTRAPAADEPRRLSKSEQETAHAEAFLNVSVSNVPSIGRRA